MPAKTITAKELAHAAGTDGRTMRKFLRSVTPADERPGKGSKWVIDARSTKRLLKQYAAWVEAKKAPEADEAPIDADDED